MLDLDESVETKKMDPQYRGKNTKAELALKIQEILDDDFVKIT